jgi:polar amino acid transport system substrate-binding protein
MRPTLLALVAAMLAMVLVAAGCGGGDDGGGGEAAGGVETIEEGVLTVGTDAPFPPFEIGRPPDVTGYDIEVMNAIAEDLGLEAEYVNSSFDTIFRDVAQGRFDIVAAASTITPQREETVDFSDPYYEAQQALLIEEGSDVASVDDLSGLTVGAQDGTTGETFANDETEAAEVRGFPQGPDAINALVGGQVDAVIIDQPVALDAVEEQGGVEVVEEIETGELYGFAMAPGNTALREQVNEALTRIKDDGTLEQLYDEYFQMPPPDTVLEGTNEPE